VVFDLGVLFVAVDELVEHLGHLLARLAVDLQVRVGQLAHQLVSAAVRAFALQLNPKPQTPVVGSVHLDARVAQTDGLGLAEGGLLGVFFLRFWLLRWRWFCCLLLV